MTPQDASHRLFAKRPRRRGSAAILGLAAACTVATSIAQEAPRYCEVALTFSLEGHEIASPTALVEFGQPADITVGDATHGWHFSIAADAPKTIHRVNTIPIEIDLYEVLRGQQVLRASPHLGVAPGQRADVDTIFADDGRSAHIGLVANVRSEAEIEAIKQRSSEGGS